MRTKASLFGHALHAMLVPVPLGALPTALVFNGLHVYFGDPAWFRAAFVATLVGAVGLVAAIIPGFIDYFTSVPRRGEVWTHASVHMALGSALTGFFVGSAALHWMTLPGASPAAAWSALALNAVGVVGLTVQGFLGGGLVGEHQIGVRTGYPQELPSSSRARGAGRRRRGPAGGGGSE